MVQQIMLPFSSTAGLREAVDPATTAVAVALVSVAYHIKANFHTLLVEDTVPQYLASVVCVCCHTIHVSVKI